MIEGDESAGFFKRWASAFNLKEKFIDAYRWAATKSKNPRFRDTVNDSLLLFGFSHLAEMASGPIMLGVGAAYDWPDWVMGAVAVGGTTISIPGLDPMCILIFGAYAKSANFRSAVGTVRAALMPSIQMAGLSGEMLLEDMMSLVREAKLQKLEGLTRVRSENENLTTYYFSHSAIELELQKNQHGTFLHAVTIHKNLLVDFDKAAFKAWLQPLGWNAKNLITKALQITVQQKDLHSAFNKLYVKSVKQNNSVNRIELNDHAVSVAEESCDQLLAPSLASVLQ